MCKEILISFFDLLDIASNRCIHSFIMLAIASFNLNEPSAHFTMNHPISSHMNPTLVFHSKADKAIFVSKQVDWFESLIESQTSTSITFKEQMQADFFKKSVHVYGYANAV